jgi:hypothetical protein
MVNKTVFSDTQAAFILGVTRQTIFNMKGRGDLPKTITKEAIEKYISAEESKVEKMRRDLVYVTGEAKTRKLAQEASEA